MKDISNYSVFTWLMHFLTLLVSSFVIILVLTGAHERMSVQIISSMNQELVQYADTTAKQVRNILTASTYQNFFNQSVTSLRRNSEISNFGIVQAMRVLNSFSSSSSFIESVYVYNRKKNFIYSTKDATSQTCQDFFDQDAVKIFTGRKSPSNELLYRGNVYSFIVCETDSDNFCENAMMVNLDSDAFNQLYYGYSKDECFLYRRSNNSIVYADKTLADINSAHPIIAEINYSKNLSGYISLQEKGKKTAYIYSYLPDPQLYYVRKINFDELNVQLKNFRYLSIELIGIIIAGWILVSILIMIRFYIPLKKVVTTLTENSSKEKEDLFLNNLDEWVQGAAENKKEYLKTLKEEYLKQLLVSALPENHSIKDSFSKYEIQLNPAKPVFILLTSAESLPEFKDFNDSHFEEVCYIFEKVKINGLNVFVLQLEKVTTRYIFFSHILEKMPTIICCSDLIVDWRKMRRSFTRLQELYAMHIFYPETKVFFETLLDSHKKESNYPEELENKLFHALKMNNEQEARRYFEEIISFLTSYRYTTIVFGLKRLYLMLTSLYRKMLTIEENAQLKFDVDYISAIIEQAENLEQVKDIYFELFRHICTMTGEILTSRHKKISEQVKLIIEEQFKNPQLSPAIIAEQLQFSDTYISKIFKSSEKISIADYMNEVRLKHSLRLLRETKMTIKEITDRIGITNSQYFFVLFKKHYGISPAKYRSDC